ncbi:MAG: hypothetical protein KBD01_06725 [Acidobacteria bacterium]|nr:hypothetical protein [Acidobacteriota bacterium]
MKSTPKAPWRLFALAVAGAAYAAALAAPAPGPRDATVPDDATLVASGAVIGRITIVTDDIFDTDDPAEGNLVFRVANRLHVRTRPAVIEHQLSFRQGDPYSRAALEESERLLRGSGYLYEATIRPVRWDGRNVDIEVRTRDVWTLKAGVGFGRSGGTNRSHFGLQDANFLGTGKDLLIRQRSSVDRTETLYHFADPGVFGSHARFSLDDSQNSDGYLQRVALERPFWRLDSRWAAGIVAQRGERIDTRYALGSVTDSFRRQHTFGQVYGGYSPGRSGRFVRRYTAGFTVDRDIFGAAPGFDAPALIPGNRELSYPWLAFDLLEDGFVRVRDREKIGRTEDVNMGQELHAQLGYASPAFGSDRQAALLDLAWNLGLRPGPGRSLLLSVAGSGRAESGGMQDGLASASARYYGRTPTGSLWYASLGGQAGLRLQPDHQVTLGGDNGLRGYPLRYATGDRSLLLTLEKRFYREHEYFHLFRVGAAIFADVGRAWGGSDPSAHLGTLGDVGLGLRLGQSRSAHASIIRFDLAFPFTREPGIRGSQFLVSTGVNF